MDKIAHEVFQKHFEKLSNVSEEELFDTVLGDNNAVENAKLNDEITIDEALKCIKRLKNNKSCGYDGILNEFLKAS
jgi:hypothetical protein